MTTLHIKLAGVTGFTALLACVMVGLGTPVDAGACSCLEPSLDLVLEEVILLNPEGLSDEALDARVASETAAWPVEAQMSYDGSFGGVAGDTVVDFRPVEEGDQ